MNLIEYVEYFKTNHLHIFYINFHLFINVLKNIFHVL
jgi:hypothetical protein